ncbi:MAG: DsrE family protein [Phycisphaerae bacterium]
MRTAGFALITGLVLLSGCGPKAPTVTTNGTRAVGLRQTENIRVVYQIKTDGRKDGVGAGLHYVEKLLDTYNQIGIPDSAAEVRAVFHGDAAYWLLRDEPYSAVADGEQVNPNKQIITELLRRNVHLEICAQTMQAHGWKKRDVMEGVLIVVGAYPRVIDLQSAGFAYIRF